MDTFYRNLPKVELHSHIEGTMEPPLILKLAERNKIKLPYDSIDKLADAYQFTDLQSFLDLYFLCANTLKTAEDFYDMTMAYFERCYQDSVLHTETFVEFQSYLESNISADIIMDGLIHAIKDGLKKYDVSCSILLCFLSHKPVEQAIATLKHAKPWYDHISGVGLAAAEKPFPRKDFKAAFDLADKLGFKKVAHAGEEGPADYVWQAIRDLKVDRIDHGVRSLDDPSLIAYLAEHKTPLTVCPLSNVKLKVFPTMAEHNIHQLYKAGVNVTINADDPSFFGGYVTENYEAVAQALPFTQNELVDIARNGILASFMDDARKQYCLDKLEQYCTECAKA